ncbi:hypothetical protein ACLOJK_041509 [Asimina triloba]
MAAAMSVLKLLIVTGVGSVLAMKRIGIFGAQARKHLNNVTYASQQLVHLETFSLDPLLSVLQQVAFYVFNPAFVYSSLSKTITFKSVVSLWFMPVNILLTFVLGTILGWAVIQITKPPSQLRGLILGCCAGGNMGLFLIIIVPAICKEKGSPFGAQDTCTKFGLAYASLSLAIGAVFLWSYVYNVVRISSTGRNKGTENGTLPIINAALETLKAQSVEPNSGQDPKHCEDQGEPESATNGQLTNKPKSPIVGILKQTTKTSSHKVDWKKLFAPSTIGAIVGFFVGVIGPMRRVFVGENAPLRVIQASAALLGDGSIPTTTLIMGGNLTKGLRKSRVRVSVIIAIIIVRYILLPLLGIVVVKGAIRFGLIHKDPLYEFILLLQFSIPPAMALDTWHLFGRKKLAGK